MGLLREKIRRETLRRLEGSLLEFVKAAWPIVDPNPYKDGWHVEALCRHLEAATEFDIQLLLANLPPRHSKSLLVSVIWPAWVWTKYPERKFIFITYHAKLAGRDAGRMRMILTSPWYQGYWGEKVQLRDDKNTESEFYNTKNGMRFSTAIDGRLTGEGADYLVIDDPHNAVEAYSLATMVQAEMVWTEALPSRVNDPMRSAKIVACQRIAPNDLSSVILRQNSKDLVHLCLPALYDPDRHCRTPIGWSDPRETKDEPLFPARWPYQALMKLKSGDDKDGGNGLTPFGWAAQYQQDPRAKGANIFTRDLWRFWTRWKLPVMEQIIVSLDCAAKDNIENDYTGCCVLGLFKPDDDGEELNAMLLGAWKRRLQFTALKAAVIETIDEWTERCDAPPDWIFIEDKSAGIQLIQELQMAGIGPIQSYNPGRASKMERGYALEGVWRDGTVWVPGRKIPADKLRSDRFAEPYGEEVIQELEMFPRAQHDDLTDALFGPIQFYRDRRFLSVSTDKEPDEAEMIDRDFARTARVSPYG